mgnify:FL=1
MSQMLYLNSVESTYSETDKYYRFTLPRPITTDNKSLSLRLVECEIPITYFNIITDYNDKFSFLVQAENSLGQVGSKVYNIVIPQKNYSVQEMLTTLNLLIVAEGATFNSLTTTMSFNSQTLRFNINVVSSSSSVVVRSIAMLVENPTRDITSMKVLGFIPGVDTVFPDATTGVLEFSNSINMNRTKNIYIMTNNLGLNTRTNSNNNKLSILSKVQASQPFGSIVSYQSESDNYITINPQITYIDHVDLYLLDDEGADLYLNGVNWCVSLVFQEERMSNSVSTFQTNRTLTQLSM